MTKSFSTVLSTSPSGYQLVKYPSFFTIRKPSDTKEIVKFKVFHTGKESYIRNIWSKQYQTK